MKNLPRNGFPRGNRRFYIAVISLVVGVCSIININFKLQNFKYLNRSSLSSKSRHVVFIEFSPDQYSERSKQKTLTNYSWIRPFRADESRMKSMTIPTAFIANNVRNLLQLDNITMSASLNHGNSEITILENMRNTWLGLLSFISPYRNDVNMSLIDKMLVDTRRIDGDVDVLAFVDLNQPEQSFSTYLNHTCPHENAVETLKTLLLKIGESSDKVACIDLPYPAFQVFHGDFLVARPTILRSYGQWLTLVAQSLEKVTLSDEKEKSLNRSVSTSSPSCLLSQSHLLASHYFNANMRKIITNKDYQKMIEPDPNHACINKCAKEFNNVTLMGLQNATRTTRPWNQSLSSIVFILCHDKESSAVATRQFSTQFPWAYAYFIPSTYYFETYFYSHILGTIMDDMKLFSSNTNNNISWIGSLSWKADEKTNLAVVNYMITDLALNSYDVLGFYDMDDSVWELTEVFHPGMMETMVYMLQGVGESTSDIEKLKLGKPAFQNFFGTYFVTRPRHMKGYIDWLSKIIRFMTTDRKAQNMMWSNSGYGGNMDAAKKVFGLSYYPMHPFLGERFVQYYFNVRGFKVMLMSDYRTMKGI